MKYALINDKKTEATKGAKGLCPMCDSELIAKCGEVKINHWAHKSSRNCDPWWENETDWHRSWKGQFPVDWQEVVQRDKRSGEKHIADVKTPGGWVLEFQHSYLNPEERRARNAFYSKLVWVVDGLRRKTDLLQFQRLRGKPPIRRAHFPECRLLKEWCGCALVFFDFQEPMLWLLVLDVYLIPFSRNALIGYHHDKRFDEIVEQLTLPIRDPLVITHRVRVPRVRRYPVRKRRRKRRF